MTGQAIFLVVCTANVCRSPAAEILLNRAFQGAGCEGEVRAVSAGVDARPGEPMCGQAGGRLGDGTAAHEARSLTVAALQSASIVLALDRSHRSACARLDPGCRPRLFTLRQAALLADGVRASVAAGGRPAGSPPLPDGPAERLRWLVAELDAARADLAGVPADDLEIVDRHGPEPHAEVVDEITDATTRLAAAAATVLAADAGETRPYPDGVRT